MYIINSDALARDLKLGTVSQKDKLIYFLLFILLHSMVSIRTNVLGVIIDLLITVVGIFICYKANRKGDNKEFIERFICLSLPINLSMILIGSMPILILSIVFLGTKWDTGYFYLFAAVGSRIWFYGWMRLQLLNISGAK